ncbi:hypothetical protein HNQ38_002167 [Desulfovibrio intestinalis]|uniref:Uncharacterized protein n=1 Tax=Desulfovibrio intestinalis TaxID=58621 RepID=A0A7W8C4C3_9BACT|nr:hypothetical protein [Desulfovibrio intestinalis]
MGVEIYENPAGSSGGSAEGASEGRQPLTGPFCRPPRRRPNNINGKAPCPQGTTHISQKTNSKFSASPHPAHQTPPAHTQRNSAMALRGAQGDHPTEGREAPEAKTAQPSRNDGIWKAREGLLGEVEIYESPAGSSGGSAEGGLGGAAAPNRPLLPRAA